MIYVNVEEKTSPGEDVLARVGNTGGLIGNFQYQCLVQLSVLPVAFCHGAGATNDEAYEHAAHNALLYLKITTKKA